MSVAAVQPARSGGYRRGIVLVLLGALASSWMGLGVRMFEDATAWQILAIRSFSMMVFLLIIIAWRNPGQILSTFRQAAGATLVGGVAIAVAFCGIIVAIQSTTVANAMFLLAAAPFLAAILGRLFLGEHVRPATWLAIVVSLSGVGIMVAENISFGHLWGNVAAAAAALGLAVFLVALRSKPNIEMLPVAAFGGLLGTIAALFMCFVVTGVGLSLSTHDVGLAIALGVFQLGLACYFITVGARYVPAAEVALLNLVEVVLGPLWVWMAFSETTGPYTLIGGALVLAAVIGDTLTGERERRRQIARAKPSVFD